MDDRYLDMTSIYLAGSSPMAAPGPAEDATVAFWNVSSAGPGIAGMESHLVSAHLGVRPRRTRRKATRERICSAAREIFLTQGYAAATVEQIALAAGVGRSTLYTHFGDKGDLLAAIADDYFGASRKSSSACLDLAPRAGKSTDGLRNLPLLCCGSVLLRCCSSASVLRSTRRPRSSGSVRK